MKEYSQTIRLGPPGWHHKAWYAYLGLPCPDLVPRPGPMGSDWARLVPYENRRFHWAYAKRHGFYWIPCPLCDRPFGGHEAAGSIPDPMYPPKSPHGPFYSLHICSQCTRAGKSHEAL